MNNKTIQFHLENIEKNNRYLSHKKEIENEIASLRAVAFHFPNSAIGAEKTIEANILEEKLRKSELIRMKI